MTRETFVAAITNNIPAQIKKAKRVRFLKTLLFGSIVFIIAFFTGYQFHKNRIDLPEEIRAVTPSDNLKGYYTNDGILHIEYNNK